MKKKQVPIYLLIAAVICTALCTTIFLSWYRTRTRKIKCNTTIVAEVLSKDGDDLLIKSLHSPSGLNGTYTLTYDSDIFVFDTQNKNMNFSDLAPNDHVSIFFQDYEIVNESKKTVSLLKDNDTIPDVVSINLLEGDSTEGVSINLDLLK